MHDTSTWVLLLYVPLYLATSPLRRLPEWRCTLWSTRRGGWMVSLSRRHDVAVRSRSALAGSRSVRRTAHCRSGSQGRHCCSTCLPAANSATARWGVLYRPGGNKVERKSSRVEAPPGCVRRALLGYDSGPVPVPVS